MVKSGRTTSSDPMLPETTSLAAVIRSTSPPTARVAARMSLATGFFGSTRFQDRGFDLRLEGGHHHRRTRLRYLLPARRSERRSPRSPAGSRSATLRSCARDAEILLLGNRSVFTRTADGAPGIPSRARGLRESKFNKLFLIIKKSFHFMRFVLKRSPETVENRFFHRLMNLTPALLAAAFCMVAVSPRSRPDLELGKRGVWRFDRQQGRYPRQHLRLRTRSPSSAASFRLSPISIYGFRTGRSSTKRPITRTFGYFTSTVYVDNDVTSSNPTGEHPEFRRTGRLHLDPQ